MSGNMWKRLGVRRRQAGRRVYNWPDRTDDALIERGYLEATGGKHGDRYIQITAKGREVYDAYLEGQESKG